MIDRPFLEAQARAAKVKGPKPVRRVTDPAGRELYLCECRVCRAGYCHVAPAGALIDGPPDGFELTDEFPSGPARGGMFTGKEGG